MAEDLILIPWPKERADGQGDHFYADMDVRLVSTGKCEACGAEGPVLRVTSAPGSPVAERVAAHGLRPVTDNCLPCSADAWTIIGLQQGQKQGVEAGVKLGALVSQAGAGAPGGMPIPGVPRAATGPDDGDDGAHPGQYL